MRDLKGPHVDRQARTVQFEPTFVESYDGIADGTLVMQDKLLTDCAAWER